ncbi:metal-dependent hydrolase [Agromyces archimandritae]|uniref:Metal-dependent hydrolase n=1 Tax=Agromyces archimandritae TaxID=2781962 RepID=A0A975FN29_9MICO|nr:metal-dependent hydrolase [Agromyces archimandritae]QTX04036.1 metal-dependent hydrolase [Agromyces archimandritae]
MTLPAADTRVVYPAGELTARARVLHVEPLGDGRAAVLTDVTSVHPLDPAWPDQPADRAWFETAGGEKIPIVDAVVAATDGLALFVGDAVPVRKGTESWAFVVAHLVPEDAGIAEGDELTTAADEAFRDAVSAGHTACHLAALALNAAVAERWTKEPRRDSLGSPDFDSAANSRSTILEYGSLDRYRLNKSLRRAGFDAAGFLDALQGLDADVEARLAIWVGSAAPVRVECEGEGLTDRRTWVCELPEGTARIPCGGTHVRALGEFGGIRTGFSVGEEGGSTVVDMSTAVTMR